MGGATALQTNLVTYSTSLKSQTSMLSQENTWAVSICYNIRILLTSLSPLVPPSPLPPSLPRMCWLWGVDSQLSVADCSGETLASFLFHMHHLRQTTHFRIHDTVSDNYHDLAMMYAHSHSHLSSLMHFFTDNADQINLTVNLATRTYSVCLAMSVDSLSQEKYWRYGYFNFKQLLLYNNRNVEFLYH